MRLTILALLPGALLADSNPLLCSIGSHDPEWRQADEIAAYNTLNGGGTVLKAEGDSGLGKPAFIEGDSGLDKPALDMGKQLNLPLD